MNGPELWTAVDAYFEQALVPPDPRLEMALVAGRMAGLPMRGSIAPSQGRFLELLVRMLRAKRVLEVGTLGGYSTIWLARGLAPDGQILTLELREQRADAARQTFERVGLGDVIEVRSGQAADTLQELVDVRVPPYNLIFIDADKQNNATYFRQAVELSRPGTVIVVDNVVREGRILAADAEDQAVRGVHELTAAVAAEPRVRAGVVQIVTSKRHDGFALVVVA